MFWWILLGILGLGMIWLIIEVITPQKWKIIIKQGRYRRSNVLLFLPERNERHEVFRFVCRNWRLSIGFN